jgi:hypothetical protein
VPNVHNAHDLGGLIDREEDAIDVRTVAVVEDANCLAGVEALRRYPISPWELLERKDRLLEAIEPGHALAWRAFDDPQIQLFELKFGALSKLNAVCHAYAADG